MPLMRGWAAAAAALVMLAGPAWAGTSSEPEVTDPTGDVRGPGGQDYCPTSCTAAPNFVDLVSGWVAQEVEGELVLRIDSGNNANAYGHARYQFHFTVNGQSYMAGMAAEPANTQGGLPGNGATSPLGVATSAAWVETVITLVVPLSAIGDPAPGDAITDTFLTSTLAMQGQDTFSDRAPDSGFGADYTFPADEVPVNDVVATVHLNVTAGPLTHTFNGSAGAFAINWTAPADVVLAFNLTGNGTANVTVHDSAGTLQFSCQACGNMTQRLNGTAGIWMIAANYTGLNGTASLQMEAWVEPNPVVEGPDGVLDNTTAPPRDEESPMPFVALVGALVVAAVRRRNR